MLPTPCTSISLSLILLIVDSSEIIVSVWIVIFVKTTYMFGIDCESKQAKYDRFSTFCPYDLRSVVYALSRSRTFYVHNYRFVDTYHVLQSAVNHPASAL